jgi:uncharacterized membrane-anchored protein
MTEGRRAADGTAVLWSKVPAITISFWLIKLLSTTVGETGADYLAVHVGLGAALTTGLMCVLLLAALLVQISRSRCVPWIYWLTVVLLSVVGTQITDILTDTLHVSLYVSTSIFVVLLAAWFWVWHRAEGTLSINAIDTRSRELYYWGAILVTFALGTAAGDLATEALGLGFRLGTLVFAGLIAVIAVAWRAGMNAVLAFWLAYILTRPLGASLGDLLAQAREYGGLGLGTVVTSAVFLAVIAALVLWISVRGGVRSPAAAMKHSPERYPQ